MNNQCKSTQNQLDYIRLIKNIQKLEGIKKRSQAYRLLGLSSNDDYNRRKSPESGGIPLRRVIEYIIKSKKHIEYVLAGTSFIPRKAYGEPPGSTISPGNIGDYREEHKISKKRLFDNENLADQIIEDLAYLEKTDRLSFDYFTEQIIGKAWRLRLKKTGDDT